MPTISQLVLNTTEMAQPDGTYVVLYWETCIHPEREGQTAHVRGWDADGLCESTDPDHTHNGDVLSYEEPGVMFDRNGVVWATESCEDSGDWSTEI